MASFTALVDEKNTGEFYGNGEYYKTIHTSARFSSESLRGRRCRRRILRDYRPVAVAALSDGCLVSLAFVVGLWK